MELYQQASGSYRDAQLLLALAYSIAANVNANDPLHYSRDASSLEDLINDIQAESRVLFAPGVMPEADCPDWLYVRGMYQRAHAISEGRAEEELREGEAVTKLGEDVAKNAGELAKEILTPTALLVAGVLIIVFVAGRST